MFFTLYNLHAGHVHVSWTITSRDAEKGKATQHNLPETVIFQEKLAALGWRLRFEPTTIHFSGDALTNLATEACTCTFK